MDTVQSRRISMVDDTLKLDLNGADFHLKMLDDDQVSKYCNAKGEASFYRVDTKKYWDVSQKVKRFSFKKR